MPRREIEIEDLLPADLPRGADLVAAGRRRAAPLPILRSNYCRERGVRCERDYKAHARENGIATTFMNIGYESWAETAAAVNELNSRGRRHGYFVDRITLITDRRMGLPPEMRAGALKETGLMFDNEAEWLATAKDVETQCQLSDHNLHSPAAVDNTEAAIKAGICYVGNFATFSYRYPEWPDDVSRFSRTVEALGMLAEKRADCLVENYQDDGFPGSFYDVATMLGWSLFTRYITAELVGVEQSQSFGSQWSDPILKRAYALALAKINPERTPAGYIHCDTNSFDAEDSFERVAAVTALDAYLNAAGELSFPSGAAIHVTPVSEAIRIPTMDDLHLSMLVAKEAIDRSRQTAGSFDWRPVEELSERIVIGGRQVFDNLLSGLPQLGIDVRDPLQILLGTARLGAARLEELFNAGQPEPSAPRGFTPVVTSEVLKRLVSWRDQAIARITEAGGLPDLRGVKIVAGSGDIHEYGLFVVTEVLARCGASVVDLGTSVGGDDLAKVAREAAADALVVSTLNGGAFAFAQRIREELARRSVDPPLFLGGRLTEDRDGDSSVDVRAEIREAGAFPCDSIDEMMREIRPVLAGRS